MRVYDYVAGMGNSHEGGGSRRVEQAEALRRSQVPGMDTFSLRPWGECNKLAL